MDFKDLKAHVKIEDVAAFLGIQTKGGDQLRGPCPVCKSKNPRALAITKTRGAFYCFSAKTGGDLIALMAHVRGTDVKDAAHELAAHFGLLPNGHPSSPKQPEAATNAATLQKIGERLNPDHPDVLALGFDASTARALGIGHDARGYMRGRVCIPVRLPTGEPAGFIGISPNLDPPIKHPPSWFIP